MKTFFIKYRKKDFSDLLIYTAELLTLICLISIFILTFF